MRTLGMPLVLLGLLLYCGTHACPGEDAFRGADFSHDAAWSFSLTGKPAGGTVTLAVASNPAKCATVKTVAGESLAAISQRLADELQSIKGTGFARAQYVPDRNEIVLYNSTQGQMVLRSTDPGITTYEAVKDLAASTSPKPASVTLQWKLPDSGFDAIVVLMYGSMVVRLPGTATQATHPAPGNAHSLTQPLHRAVIDFTVVGIKNDIPSDSAQVAVVNPISPPDLDISTPSLPAATKGTAYRQTLTSVAGTAPFTWSVAEGSLPVGLSLSASGELGGTPTKAGVYRFTARVTDAWDQPATRKFTLEVDE